MDICLIESDDGVREVLIAILEDAHCTMHSIWPPTAALDYLRATSTPHVVLISNQAPDNLLLLSFFEQVAADGALATSHRYIALTTAITNFDASAKAMLASLNVPIIEKPFNLDTLLAAISG